MDHGDLTANPATCMTIIFTPANRANVAQMIGESVVDALSIEVSELRNVGEA